jgi:potassium/hydrogen antiporter
VDHALEASGAIEIARHTLLSCGVILAIGTLAAFAAQRIRIPDVAIFLLAGIAIGPHGLRLVDIPAASALNQIILLFGASYILFDGGAALRLQVFKQVWITIVLLATIGVLVTAAITAFAAAYVFALPLATAGLLGATLAATDPATLAPIFRQVRVRERVAQTVVAESAFNDATGAIATFAMLALATGGSEFSLAHAVFDLARQSVLGILSGIALG